MTKKKKKIRKAFVWYNIKLSSFLFKLVVFIYFYIVYFACPHLLPFSGSVQMKIYWSTMFSSSVLVSINSCLRLLIYPSLLKTDILLSGNPQTVCTPVYLLPFPSPIISLQNIKVFFFSFCPLLVVFNLLLYISWLSLCFLLSRIFQ